LFCLKWNKTSHFFFASTLRKAEKRRRDGQLYKCINSLEKRRRREEGGGWSLGRRRKVRECTEEEKGGRRRRRNRWRRND